jgi:dihydrofolate reductase
MAERVLIAALAERNRTIGKSGKIPWSIPADMRRFKQLTIGHAVIMGRKTWEFDLEKKPLVDRLNIVVTSQPDRFQVYQNPSLQFVNSLKVAFQLSENYERNFIIGGSSLYQEALTLVDRWELTLVERTFEGDTFFPPYEHLIGTLFEQVDQVIHSGYRFETYQRIQDFKYTP